VDAALFKLPGQSRGRSTGLAGKADEVPGAARDGQTPRMNQENDGFAPLLSKRLALGQRLSLTFLVNVIDVTRNFMYLLTYNYF
jgi:hypothetical protein